jgi:hypothetical protein
VLARMKFGIMKSGECSVSAEARGIGLFCAALACFAGCDPNSDDTGSLVRPDFGVCGGAARPNAMGGWVGDVGWGGLAALEDPGTHEGWRAPRMLTLRRR